MKKHLQRNRLKKIINHVIYGIQMAKKFKLGKRMVDIKMPIIFKDYCADVLNFS